MLKTALLASVAGVAVALISAQPVYAQAAPSSPATAEGTALPQAGPTTSPDSPAANSNEDIVVTGSYIRGTPKDAALPVDVFTADSLAKQGSPQILEIIKTLPASAGALGQTNIFDGSSSFTEGINAINLRGLGRERTLVLFNGRRLVNDPLINAVNLNLLPLAAVGRIEVLKEGAAATYGSDAIAGVVNFITRKNLNGIELQAQYDNIKDSGGDVDLSAVFGHKGSGWDILLSAGYQHKSPSNLLDSSVAFQPYAANPDGGWSATGSPSTFQSVNSSYQTLGAVQRDVGCAPLGHLAGISGTTPTCLMQTSIWDHLTEQEDRFQLYGEFNMDLPAGVSLHAEALYSHTNLPDVAGVGGPALNVLPIASLLPAGYNLGRYFVPATNPGFIAYMAANPGQFPVGTVGAQLFNLRPVGAGGNPLYMDVDPPGHNSSQRRQDGLRLSADLSGDISSAVHWSAAVTYMQQKDFRNANETLVGRYELALRGLGGPNCTGTTPGANGCQWWNPFSNAVSGNPALGLINPGYNAAVANDTELFRWFSPKVYFTLENKLLVGDAVLSGKTGITLPGGDVGWAVGGQVRRTTFTSHYSDLFNLGINPCIDTPLNGNTSCTVKSGPLAFSTGGYDQDLTGTVYAAFAELSLPITTTIQGQAAARYEDYGDNGGSTFNPKLSLRWQVFGPLALRGSVGTTFRGPPVQYTVINNSSTSLTSILGSIREVDLLGNPDLKPESAFTYSAGTVFKVRGILATIDYWSFDFKNSIVQEPINGLVSAVFPNGATGANNCANTAVAAIVARYQFVGGVCAAGNYQRLTTYWTNGARVKTSGIDFGLDAEAGNFLGADWSLGGTASYVLRYDVGATSVEGVVVSPAFDAAGFLNYQTGIAPIPPFKGQAYLNAGGETRNLRLTANYVDGYTDQRTSLFTTVNANLGYAVTRGQQIKPFVTFDLSYQQRIGSSTTLTATVQNLLDQDPPFARLGYNYDPYTANPFGRIIKLNITQRF